MPLASDTNTFPADAVQSLEDAVDAGLYWLDIATDEVFWSRGIYRLLDLSPSEVRPSRALFSEMAHLEDSSPLHEINRLFAAGAPFQIEYRIITPKRRARWISNQGEFLMDRSGKPATLIGVLRDVTESHATKEQLRDRATRLNSILKLTNGFAWTAKPNSELTSVTNWQNSNVARADPLGSSLLDLIHPDDRASTQEIWENATREAKPFTIEHRLLHRDGYRWRKCFAKPIQSVDGNLREWIGASFDVEDEKANESIQQSTAVATGAQIRAARSMLRLSVRDLSTISGVSVSTIRRIEDIDGVSSGDEDTNQILRLELEKRGAAFLFPPGFKPGVSPA